MARCEQLIDDIYTESILKCHVCKRSATKLMVGIYSAARYFYEDGWRARKRVYCPQCAERKLKRRD